ncbi:ROK family protein [Streptomyces sp. NBC_01267]|uniref:ROK family transcriptional regulator n=1 Tax=unclassified Streptomyces TaxID=2593676 RepID=UPI002025A672|nr:MULTISPECIES: ROK family transcriptional regulator [unclassified Streptomyces]MCX4553365.1 ROK family protein [Streptomyces sp. NBC_01500]WSC18328.1 ROK family protein [Streptomyces sp. NBC_01766]WSV52370.1 ROK family protein [Streptomyces sp. NBC_01014]
MTEPTDALQRLRRANEAAVLGELRRSGALSRGELKARIGLSRTTLFAIVSDLLERKAVVEQPAAESEQPRGRGRPALEISLNARGAELIGIDLQRNRIHVIVANCAHQVIGRSSAPVPADSGPAERAAQAVEAVEELVRREGISLAPVEGIGLGLPGFVQNPASGDPRTMTPFATHVAAELGEHFGVPVLTDNNSRLAALAEVTWGAARGHDNTVFLAWSEGVGGGLVVNGTLVRGAHGAAGEIGHTSVDPQGPVCHCGGRGCLEGVISLPALLAACADRGVRAHDAAEFIALAADGQPDSADVLRGAAVTAGRVLAALAAHVDPECIVVYGEPAALDELVLTPIREQLAALSLPSAPRTITVCGSALGADAAALGGVALLLHTTGQDLAELLDRPVPGAGGPGADQDSGAPGGGSGPTLRALTTGAGQ